MEFFEFDSKNTMKRNTNFQLFFAAKCKHISCIVLVKRVFFLSKGRYFTDEIHCYVINSSQVTLWSYFTKDYHFHQILKSLFCLEISPENIIVGNLLVEESNSDGLLLQEDFVTALTWLWNFALVKLRQNH